MKIIVFHLPYPMGNYKLNQVLADKLSEDGHEVYCIEQLNGLPYNEDYYQQIKSVEPDVLYYEMLDKGTFEVVEKFNCNPFFLTLRLWRQLPRPQRKERCKEFHR